MFEQLTAAYDLAVIDGTFAGLIVVVLSIAGTLKFVQFLEYLQNRGDGLPSDANENYNLAKHSH